MDNPPERLWFASRQTLEANEANEANQNRSLNEVEQMKSHLTSEEQKANRSSGLTVQKRLFDQPSKMRIFKT
jgi:hypothetical protein